MIHLAASDLFPEGEKARTALAVALLAAVNLAFKGAGHKGCTITDCEIYEGGNGRILTVAARPGDTAATMDNMRAAMKRAMEG